jgi:hypothetical protein
MNLKYIRARDIDPMELIENPSSQMFAVAYELSKQCLSKLEHYVDIKKDFDDVLGHQMVQTKAKLKIADKKCAAMTNLTAVAQKKKTDYEDKI